MSKNIFKDIGFSGTESKELLRKASCFAEIVRIVRLNDYTQKDLTKIFDVSQSRISDLLKGKVSKFSLDFLVECLELLGAEPEIKFKKKKPAKLRMKLVHEISKNR